MMYTKSELFELLEEKAKLYNQPAFIETDPIQIPKFFSKKENIEIAGFLTASIAWGQRPVIISNAKKLIHLMDNDPYEFLLHTDERDWQHLESFKHRTFNNVDLLFFLKSLKNIYLNHGGLESVFNHGFQSNHSIFAALINFRRVFFEIDFPSRTEKHISNVTKNSSAKRLNMFLRWMVRKDQTGVDFGLWKDIPASALMLPLDVHTGNISRGLGLLTRHQNDWKAVEEITAVLRGFDPLDPIKYDFALFGMGAFENHK